MTLLMLGIALGLIMLIFFFFFKCNRTIGSRSIGHRVWSMSLKLSEN